MIQSGPAVAGESVIQCSLDPARNWVDMPALRAGRQAGVPVATFGFGMPSPYHDHAQLAVVAASASCTSFFTNAREASTNSHDPGQKHMSIAQ